MGNEYLQVGCFGKLPFWREYLEIGARSVASRALRAWLREGRELHVLETTADDQPAKNQAFEAHLRVLLSLPDADDLLVGIVRPSRDGGGRHAPFTVFVRLPRRYYGRHYALLPSALGSVWEALDDAWDALHDAPSQSVFEELHAALEIEAPVDAKQARGGYQGRQLDDAGKLFDEPSLEALRDNMPDILERIKKSGGRDVCVALPAAKEVDEACFNASLWIDLVNRQFRLKRFDPSVLLDAREGLTRRQVYLNYGALNPVGYIRILGNAAPTEAGDVLRPVKPASGVPGNPLQATYGQLLETVF